MSNKAIFLDRDGTINVEKDYLFKIEDFEFIEGVPEAIKIFNELGFLVLVITNQAGIARGYYSECHMHKLHKFINETLKTYDAKIHRFYFCPHHPVHGKGPYKIDCNCRKPKTGMIEQAIRDFSIDVSKSYLFGDKEWDIEAGQRMNIKSYYIGDLYSIIKKLK